MPARATRSRIRASLRRLICSDSSDELLCRTTKASASLRISQLSLVRPCLMRSTPSMRPRSIPDKAVRTSGCDMLDRTFRLLGGPLRGQVAAPDKVAVHHDTDIDGREQRETQQSLREA